MPEMPNVISGEVIEADWGNDIRDRSMQRYTNAAERTALHAAPVGGDLSFLEDTGITYVYFSGAWRRFDPASHGDTHAAGGADPLGDHATAHATAGSDSLLGAISGYIATGFNQEASTDSTVTSTWETGATTTFTKPASWSTFEMMAWGSVFFRAGMEAAPPEASARINIDGTAGGGMGILGANDPDGYLFPLTIAVVQKRTGLNSSGAVSIQYSELTPGVNKYGSTVQYLAIRTS